jgi:hypothetical protein
MPNKIEGVVVSVVEAIVVPIIGHIPADKAGRALDEVLDSVDRLVSGTGTVIDDIVWSAIKAKVKEAFADAGRS